MRILTASLALFLVLPFVGCKVVYSTQPLGTEPATLEKEKLNGTWIFTEGAVQARVADAEQGMLEIGWFENNEALEPKVYTVSVKKHGDWMFASMEHADSPGKYFWGRIKHSNGQVTLWIPDFARVRDAIDAGELPGQIVDENQVILGDLSEEDYNTIMSGEGGAMISWENPIAFLRIGD